jgi:hypothetical protein
VYFAGKLLEDRRKRQNSAQVANLLPVYLENPASLVGTIFHHKCRDEDGKIEWFRRRIVSVHARKHSTEKTEYNVEYDLFPNDTWFFPMLMDLRKGDVVSD